MRRRGEQQDGVSATECRRSDVRIQVPFSKGITTARASFITSPSRKIDPATTMRGEMRQAPSSASAATRLDRDRRARRDRARVLGQRRPDRPSARFEARVTTRRLTAGSSAANMPSTSLSRIAANTSGALSPPRRSQIGRERGGAGRVVRRVEQHSRPSASRRSVEPPRPRRVGERRARWPRRGTANAVRVEQLEQPDGDDRVADLMRARQADRDVAVIAHGVRSRSSWHRRVGADASARDERRAAIAATARSASRQSSSPTTTGTPGLMMPAFSTAISRSVVPEVLLDDRSAIDVIAVDHRRRCTLVASSRPPRPTSSTAISTRRAAEQLEGDGGRDFEERRLRRRARRRRSSRSIAVADVGDGGDQRPRSRPAGRR